MQLRNAIYKAVPFEKKKILLLVLPFVLTASTAFFFYHAGNILGQRLGYFIGFLFYWFFWCLVVPVRLTGVKSIVQSFTVKHLVLGSTALLCLLVPLLFVYAYAFPRAVKEANVLIVFLSLLLSLVNATAEEVLWRGTYLTVFRNEKWLGILASSIGFAIWHYAPQIIFPNTRPGGTHSFVLVACVLGFSYAWAAWKQETIIWVSIAHALFDFAGLGARIYF